MDFNPVFHPIMLQRPKFVSTVSAWVEHFPFAFLLIELCRPRVLVELGSQQGDSYCAFCQTVDTLNTGTRCFAVDTWAGDAQAGFYGERVLADLRAVHDPAYRRFSTLMQMTFDEAVGKFDDGQIDVLHIDGLHTYEAVRHDFDTWRPKVSDRGVVLLHDTAIRDRSGFGVWQLWDELSSQFTRFEFPHSSGLGVLLLGANVPQPMKDFIAFANAHAGNVRLLFQQLGLRIGQYQDTLKVARSLIRAYEGLREWRVRAGGEALPQLTSDAAVDNLIPLSDFVADETVRALARNSASTDATVWRP